MIKQCTHESLGDSYFLTRPVSSADITVKAATFLFPNSIRVYYEIDKAFLGDAHKHVARVAYHAPANGMVTFTSMTTVKNGPNLTSRVNVAIKETIGCLVEMRTPLGNRGAFLDEVREKIVRSAEKTVQTILAAVNQRVRASLETMAGNALQFVSDDSLSERRIELKRLEEQAREARRKLKEARDLAHDEAMAILMKSIQEEVAIGTIAKDVVDVDVLSATPRQRNWFE